MARVELNWLYVGCISVILHDLAINLSSLVLL